MTGRFLEKGAGELELDQIIEEISQYFRGQLLTFDSASFDAVVSGLVLNFVPQPRGAAIDMARVARAGGAVAAYVWDYAEKMELMRYFWDAAVALDQSALELNEGRRFAIASHPL
jgi:ubiquinone/menaquinone biosynthesis C-methylase UbiE